MKTYDDYRPSGVQWIGKIPSHWEVLKTKFICSSIYAGGTPSTTRPEYWNGDIPWVASGACHDCEISEGSKFITEIGLMQSSTKMIPANTALVAMTGATCANTGYLKINACANQSVTAYINIPDFCDSRYLWYVLQSAREELLTYKTGGAQGGINVKDCANIKVCLPPLAEQEAIAKYLDYKAVQVDSIIDNNQHQIALLEELKSSVISHAVTRGINPDAPLKPSGIDWLGDIPQHWVIERLKFLCRKEKYNMKTGPFGTQLKGDDLKDEGDVRVYNQRNVIDKQFEEVKFYVTQKKADSLKSFYTKPGDILITARGTIGKAAVLSDKYEMGILHPCLIAIRTDDEIIDKNFLLYYFNYFEGFKTNIMLESNATTIEVIYTETLKNIFIAVPPIDEQQAIVTYLDQRIAKIDAQITKIQMQNQLLQEYKSSLINEVVTGKRKVID